MIEKVLNHYNIDIADCTILNFGNGLINNTWKIIAGNNEYILQKINHNIFLQPNDIAQNIKNISTYLKTKFPDYLFVSPLQTNDGEEIVCLNDKEYYRLFPFIKKSHTIDVASKPQQAYEAAKQFGAFTKNLNEFNVNELSITLPSFHNLSLRFLQFNDALINGNQQRIQLAATEINLLKSYKNIVDEFEKIKTDNDFKIRVTHHDTKISNILFGENEKGLCIIDLDTMMPGYFFSDVGDMIRTYVSPVSEEEKDFNKIKIRKDYLDAIINGYLSQMQDELTVKEKQYFIYAGKFMIYMQALRFFADYLNNDIYYGSKYEAHNLDRAKNQLVLLKLLIAYEKL